MSLQPLFRSFDEKIKLKRYQDSKELVEKSQIVLEHLRKKIAVPHTFQFFPQGSYATGTGVRPVNSDYDIDVGVEFNVCWEDHTPTTVKGWVFEAVKDLKPEKNLKADVQWRGPCVTVYYHQGSEPKYHVDLAIMAKDRYGNGMRLARGKQNAAPADQSWQPDDRRSFMEAIEKRFPAEEGEQLRRVIRCLKRWKDIQFPPDGPWAPTGLALSVAALQWFSVKKAGWGHGADSDDLEAALRLVEKIHAGFNRVWDAPTQRYIYRLTLQFPYAPHDDVLANMSNEQQQQFYQRIEKLSEGLKQARQNDDVVPLRRAFGDDFPEK